MWGEVTEVVVEVQGGEHKVGQERGFSPSKPNIECDALNNGGEWFKLAEVMLGMCGVRRLMCFLRCEVGNTGSGGGGGSHPQN
jgi:hypothetical protein